jgi:hypothetical protein
MAAEIVQINTQDFTSQNYEGQDVNLISTFDINTYLSSSSYIESFVYDNNKTILSSDYSFSQYTVLNNGQSAGTNNNIFQIEIDPEQTLIDQGFDQGQYNVYYNFFNKQIGSELQQLYISEISSDLTEIRLDSTSLTNEDIVEQANSLIQQREDSPYFLDFYLNFGNNQLVIANNIQLDNQDPTNPTILIKLYEALPAQFDLNSTLWVVTQLEESIAYQVTFEDTPIVILDTVQLNGPNFNISIKDQINNSTVALDYAALTSTALTSSFNQLSSLLEEKEIDINIDYTDFNNFTHFSSVQARLENFYYKVSLIEDYSSSIAILNNTTNNNPSASIAVYESKINNIITNFDGYEYYLYYTSGSWAWPKTTSQPPYQLATTGSALVANWYPNVLLSASNFDNSNQNNLYYSIPEYLRDDPANAPYQIFVEMVGQFYDNIWIYYKDVTEKYNADNRLENGISKDIVADAIRDFGIKLYQNNFSNDDLYTAFIGLTPQGGLFPFPNITGSLPTPSGFEYVDTLISASNDYIPLDDVNKSLYKRIYHNLPYLLKTKGTLPGLRALITSYGIPDTVLRINEFGGKDKSNTNDWDYWENTFNYSFYTTGSNYIASTWAPINGSWLTQDGVPESISFRFKTNGLPFDTASIDYQTLWQVDNNRVYLTLRYDGTGYVSGSYSGSIPNPYNQYAYLELYPDYISNPTVSASIYLPFFDGGWWSVMVNKSPEIAGNSTYTLYAGDKIYDGGNNGTALGFYATSSVFVDTVPWTSYGTSYFALGPNTINGNTYKAFSGSLQEIRYYTSPLSESAFKDYIMNPYSIEGNYLNSSPNELLFRASLGGELYTGSVSIHPKVTGSWITTSSFVGNSDFAFFTTPTFIPNTEYFFYDQVAAGIQNAVSDKIRIEDGIYPSGNTLSPFRSLAQNLAISQSYTVNTNLLEVAFSPQDEINQDISDQIGYFNIGEFIGDPRFRSSSLTSYPDLDALRDAYFEKYTKNYDLNDYIRLIKFFDNSLFKMIKDFVPARTSLASGVVIKQHLLERNRYPQPQVDNYSTIAYYTSGSNPPLGNGSVNNTPLTFQNIALSGTIAPQWNDYNPGTVENFSGGTGGTFEPFNGVSTSPYGPNGTGPENIYFITQSWIENIMTPSGSAITIHDAQDEFYDGEFSGSYIEVTDGELNPDNPYKNAPTQSVNYNTSGSFTLNGNLSTGYINWTYAIGYNGSNYSLYVNQLYINEIDNNGVDIQTALSNLGAGDTITFNIFGDVNGTSFDTNTVTGVITSLTPVSPSVWSISLSTNPVNQATFFFNYPPPFAPVNPDQFSNSIIFLNPYLNDFPNFYNSAFNPLINNVLVDRLSSFYEDIDYYPGITTPTNFNLIISGSALKAAVQDSNYTSKRVINPRYNGVKSTSQILNQWTPGDTGTYGKTPTIESLKTAIAYCDWIGGWPPDRENASAIHVQYLIKSDGTIVIPDVSQYSLFENKGTFESGERLIISSKTVSSGQPTQYRNIIRGGTRIEPILYTQFGQAPNISWNTTMSFEDITLNNFGTVGNYTALYNVTASTSPFGNLVPLNTTTQISYTNAIYGSSFSSGNGYQVDQNAILDGVTLYLDFEIDYSILANFTTAIDYELEAWVYKNGSPLLDALGSPIMVLDTPVYGPISSPSTNNFATVTGSIGLTTLPLPNATLGVNDLYTIHFKWNASTNGNFAILPSSDFKIYQAPIPTSPISSSGFNSIWGYADTTNYPYVITSSQPVLVNLYGDPNAKMSDITGSGFNPISLPWSIEYGDEFRFEGKEDFVYQVGKIFGPNESGSGRITQTGSIEVHFNGNLPVSASASIFNLDHFLIRRYVDDPAQILMEGFRPINSSGPYIVRPEYVVPELDKSIDEFILDLTQKGLL